MKHFQKLVTACVAALSIAALLPAVQATDLDRRTVIDVPYTVQVEDTILPPGRYVLRLASPGRRQHVEQETADELNGVQGHGLGLTAASVILHSKETRPFSRDRSRWLEMATWWV